MRKAIFVTTPKFAIRQMAIGVLLFLPALALADNPVDVEEYLRRFHADPKTVMNERLPKWDENGKLVDLEPRVTFEGRARGRNQLVAKPLRPGTWAHIPDSEKTDDILAGIRAEKRMTEIERRGLLESHLKATPWSGTFWPIRNGSLGWRFADPGFPTDTFKVNYSYVQAAPPQGIPQERLSPAEKYDQLLGDVDYTLTKANWQRGLDVVKEKEDVPTWYGICHGWAPAAYLESQPRHAVTVPARDGRSITFLPSDIKALASSLWADTDPDVVFLGKKCAKKHPKEDDMGRVIDPECFNTNPGTWHTTLINRIGVAKESFVMDATYDAEVWNQPVEGYKYSYFNPQTLKVSDRLFGSVIKKESFTLDKFKKYRSADAVDIVGVALDITYVIEIPPNTRSAPDRPMVRTVRYIYDLELDAGHQIIGGEWYTNRHPDFIWAPVTGFQASSSGERSLGVQRTWSGIEPVGDDFVKAAAISSKNTEPLAGIVHGLIRLAQ